MRFFASVVIFSLLPALVIYLSRESFWGVHVSDLVDPAAALVVVIVLLSLIPFVIIWQWRDLATPDHDPQLSDSERRYYDLTVMIIGAGILLLWFLLPYRSIVNGTHQEAVPRFTSPAESSAFLNSMYDWMSDQDNWHWFIFPIVLIALPYSRFVVKTPRFIRSRGYSAEAAIIAAQRGLARRLYLLSVAVQAAVNAATEKIAAIALLINRMVSRVVDTGVTIFLNLLDVAYRLTALLAILAIGLVLLIPGILTGSLILIGIGILILIGIALIAVVAALEADD